MRRAAVILLLACSFVGNLYGQSQSVVGITGMLGATDNALVRSDGTGGRRVQGAGWTLSDAGLLTAGGNFALGTNSLSADGDAEGASIDTNGVITVKAPQTALGGTGTFRVQSNSAYGVDKGPSIVFRGVYASGGQVANLGELAVRKMNSADGETGAYMSLSCNSYEFLRGYYGGAIACGGLPSSAYSTGFFQTGTFLSNGLTGARAVHFSPTLSTNANNLELTALLISPTFQLNGFTAPTNGLIVTAGKSGLGGTFGYNVPNTLSVLGDIAAYDPAVGYYGADWRAWKASWSSGYASVGVASAGTGATGLNGTVLSLGPAAYIQADLVQFRGAAGTPNWFYFTSAGWFASTDNALDIGNSAANRPRDIHLGRDINVGGFVKLAAVGTQLTLDAGGAIAVTKSYHCVDTFGDAASDQLDTINGGVEGKTLILRADDSTHDVVIGDGTGNIQTSGAFTLDHVSDTITLLFDGTNWIEIARANNGSFVLPSEWQRFRPATLRADLAYALAA